MVGCGTGRKWEAAGSGTTASLHYDWLQFSLWTGLHQHGWLWHACQDSTHIAMHCGIWPSEGEWTWRFEDYHMTQFSNFIFDSVVVMKYVLKKWLILAYSLWMKLEICVFLFIQMKWESFHAGWKSYYVYVSLHVYNEVNMLYKISDKAETMMLNLKTFQHKSTGKDLTRTVSTTATILNDLPFDSQKKYTIIMYSVYWYYFGAELH